MNTEVDEYAVAPASRDQRINDLQEDLQATRLLLKSKVEEVETTNEELKSSNEEMMSMNEELQSANEELTTANEELKNKIDELSLANADLANFMQSSDLIMVVLDRSYRIRHLTEAAKRVLPLRSTDRGRSITEFRIHLKEVDLPRAISKVFETSETYEQSTASEDGGKHFLLRITPYFYGDGSIEGATVTLVDLTEIRSLQDDLRVESERLKMAMAAGRMGYADLDVDASTVTVDQALSDQFGLASSGQYSIDEMLVHVDPSHIDLIKDTLKNASENQKSYEIDFRVLLPDQDERWIRTNGLPHRTQDGKTRIVGPTVDITAERQEMLIQELSHQELSHRIKNLFAVINSIISSAPKNNQEVADYADALLARITTLSRAYDLARHSGGTTGVNWHQLLERVLTPHCTENQLSLSGPDAFVSSDKLTTLTLMIHELATNALKYGGFASAEGNLSVSWELSDEKTIDVTWHETIPGFVAHEMDEGFGSRMIKLAAKQLKAKMERSFQDDGMVINLSFNLS